MYKLKTYQLFILLVGPFIFGMFYPFLALAISKQFEPSGMMLIFYVWLLVMYYWFIELLIKMNIKLVINYRKRGKIAISFALIGLLAINLVIIPASFPFLIPFFEPVKIVGVTLWIFSTFGNIFIIRTIAKNLKTLEIGKEASISDYLGDFFLVWFFPVGIWILQPRIQRVLGTNSNGA